MGFECAKCKKKFYIRPRYISHIALCNQSSDTPLPNKIYVHEEEDDTEADETVADETEADDTDADSTYSPGAEEATYSTDSEQSYSPPKELLTSPVTREQETTAELVEPYLMLDFLEKDDTVTAEVLPPANFEDSPLSGLHSMEILPQDFVSSNDLFSNRPVSINTPSKIKRRLFDETKTSLQLSEEKLKSVQNHIDTLKKKKKEALKDGKKSKAKRIGRNLKKSEEEWRRTCEEATEMMSDEQDEVKQNTIKKSKRKKNYCKYCNKLVTKFSEHLQSQHKDSVEGQKLVLVGGDSKTKRIVKTKITESIRKEWNALYNEKVNVHNLTQATKIPPILVKKMHKSQSKTVSCIHCQGVYRRDKLKVHLRKCENYKKEVVRKSNERMQCLKNHSSIQTPHISYITAEFHKTVLNGIQHDEVVEVALQDRLIMKFSSDFHKSRRESKSKHYIIREMRDLAKLFIKIKGLNQDVKSFEECINPIYFENVIDAALKLAKYDPISGKVEVPSVAYRLSQPIKDAANLLLNEEMAKYHTKTNVTDRKKITRIQDFLYLMDTQWKAKIGRISNKVRKYKQAEKQALMALEEDIVKLAEYIQKQYNKLINDLNNTKNDVTLKKMEAYDMLMHALVSHVMLLGRRRPVDFKSATITHYLTIDRDDSFLEMAGKKFSPEELQQCKNFHVFMVPGKNLEPVPMVLTKKMKTVLENLLLNRQNVGITEENDLLFVLVNEKLINPVDSLRIMKNKIKLKKPSHLTGNGLRHQAATFSRLQSSHPQYQDFLASALGHSLAVHRKHYQIPMGVLHKLNVYPVLHNIMTGTQSTTTTHSISPLKEQNTTIESSNNGNSDNLDITLNEILNEHNFSNPANEFPVNSPSNISDYSQDSSSPCRKKHRWSEEEQAAVLTTFGQTILQKICPPRSEIVKFKNANERLFKHLLWLKYKCL